MKILEPPTEPREPVDYDAMRDYLFHWIMTDPGETELAVWDYLQNMSDDEITDRMEGLRP